MSHEIRNNRDMAYAGEVPWHGLGTNLEPGADIDAWRKAAGLDFTVVTAPVLFAPEGAVAARYFKGKVVTYRQDDHTPLGVVSDSKYNVVQPSEVLDFYKEFVEAGDMQLETAGVLKGGRRIWALARLEREIKLPGYDITRPYFNLTTSFDGDTGTVGTFTSIRVVCANTLGMYYSEQDADTGENGQPISGFSVSHSQRFDAGRAQRRVQQLQRAADQYEKDANLLAVTGVSKAQAQEYFVGLFGKIDKTGKDLTKQSRNNIELLMKAYENGPGAQLESARGTAFGLLNAVTFYSDHLARERTAGGRLASAWYGQGRENKNAALKAALQLAVAA